jgi:hypothetical protein
MTGNDMIKVLDAKLAEAATHDDSDPLAGLNINSPLYHRDNIDRHAKAVEKSLNQAIKFGQENKIAKLDVAAIKTAKHGFKL